jgi:tetratricopeptide (TPR) repeat protein
MSNLFVVKWVNKMSKKRAGLFVVITLVGLLAGCSFDPKVAAKKYVATGNKYYDRAKYKDASIMYRRALSKDMRNGDAWYHLGLTNMKLSLYPEARRDFSRAMEIDPTNTDAIIKLGDIDLVYYMLDSRGNKALLTDLKELTQTLLKKDPKSFDGLRFSGYIALMEKDMKTAIQKYEAANQVKPHQPEMVLSLVQALFADNRPEDALKYANDLIDQQKTYGPIYDLVYVYDLRTNHPEQGEALLKKKIQNNPTQALYYLQLAFHYYMTNRKDEMTSTLARLTNDKKTFPQAHLLIGDYYLKVRDYNSALQQYQMGEKENGKDKRVYQKKMVEVLGSQGKNQEASKIVADLLKQDPKDPETIAMHATLLLQTGDRRQIKSVIGELQPLISKMPGSTTLHYNLGRAYMATGDPQSSDQARMQFLEALKIEPRYIPARVALAELQLIRNEAGKAVQTAEEVIAMDQTNLTARLIRANGLISMRENAKAREELNMALKMYPKSNDARFGLFNLNFIDRRYQEAETDANALMQANDPRGLPAIMEAKVGQGQWPQAIKFAEDQLKQAPDRDDYRLALAKILYRAGKYDECAAQYLKLIEKNPKSGDYWVRYGEAKVTGGDPKTAAEAFRKARELDPADPASSLRLAILYDSLGRHDEARKAYEDALKIRPDDPTALNNLAYIKADDGVDLDQALAYAQRAQDKLPNDLNVRDTVALIYVKKNLTDDSLRMLRELVNQKPDSPTFHLHLAMALYQKGDRPTAKKELEIALRNKPSEKEQSEIKQLMAKVG